MPELSEIYVSQIKRKKDSAHIEWFRIHFPIGQNIGPAVDDVSRATMIQKIENDKKNVATAIRDLQRNLVHGESVHIIKIGDEKYLRTDSNQTEEDNLGDLPEIKSLIQGHSTQKF